MNATVPLAQDRQALLSESFSASYAGVMAFITVATEGSFARAAERLGVGRSAVSRSVQKLEGQLGARLFSRTTRSTRLTCEGEVFFENCRPGVEHILQALEEMRDLREGPPRGPLRISAPHGFGRRVVAPLLAAFRLQYPDVGVELTLEDRPADLAADGMDVAFRDGRLDDSQVIAKQIIPRTARVVASLAYARAHGLPANLDAIAHHACLQKRQPNGRMQAWEFRVAGQVQRVSPPGEVVFNDDELILHAVHAGQGLAQLPGYLVRDGLREGSLVACLAAHAPDEDGHYLCYLSRRQLPKRVRAFIDFATAHIRARDLDDALPVPCAPRILAQGCADLAL